MPKRSKTMHKIFILFILNLLIASSALAQQDSPFIRKGNKLYQERKFKEAEIDYRKAIEKKPLSAKGAYNLGNSLYRQENYEEAIRSYSDAGHMMKESDTQNRAASVYNLGNALLKGDKLEESIEAYKQALRLNPKDENTRYNLAYAMNKQQQQQQQQQQKSGDNKDDNKDKNKEDKNQQSNKSQDQEQQDKPRDKPQISKQDAERMLKALENDEQKTMEKVNQQKAKGTPVNIEKDW